MILASLVLFCVCHLITCREEVVVRVVGGPGEARILAEETGHIFEGPRPRQSRRPISGEQKTGSVWWRNGARAPPKNRSPTDTTPPTWNRTRIINSGTADVRYAKGPKGDDGACRGSCVRCSAGCTCHRHGGMTKWAGGDYAKRKSPVYYIPRYEPGLDEIEQTRKIRKEDFYNPKKKKLSNRNREDSGQEREGMPKSPKARKESSKREREEGRMSEEGLNPFRKSSRTERSPSRGEEINQTKEIEEKIETVLREIKEDMAGIVEESRARRKELAAAREKEGEQEREDMLKSSEVRKESSKREREEGRTSKEGKNPLRNSSRTRRSPNRSQEENQSKEMDKEMKTTMIREMREEIKTLRKELAAVREENGELRKELGTVREEMRGRKEKGQLEKADWMKRMEMIEEKMEQREKKERKNNVIITGIGAISGNVERGVEEWLEREIGVKVNVKEAFKINKDKMMLAKIENWEQKKNIMLSKSKLKEKKGERMYIDGDLTKEERETQKKLRELAREERDRGKRVKIGYRKIQINGDWFRWDKRQEKLKKIC
ncbi:hypothetical protein MTP99_003410 [Tenebrio molitor]|nr:hypothetical protein MTP99_003410 [Tenebrio molitor]